MTIRSRSILAAEWKAETDAGKDTQYGEPPVQIGRHHRVATVPLVVGENEIVAGGRGSPFRFRVVVAQPEQMEGKVRS